MCIDHIAQLMCIHDMCRWEEKHKEARTIKLIIVQLVTGKVQFCKY